MKLHKDICAKCAKRKTCKVPCYPVERYLQRDNLTVFEKGHGESITLYPRSREAHLSTLSTGDDKAGNPRISTKEAEAFSTENENPFRHFEPEHKQTSIFIKRFFGKWSYKDIAAAHDMTESNARNTYHNAVQRMLAVIIEMDQVRKSMTPEERKRACVVKSKKYLEKNREKVNAKRRERYARNKEKTNAKRRVEYAVGKK